MEKFIRLSKVNAEKLPLRAATLYKWRTLRKCPELFIKLGGAVFVDLEALQELIEEGRGR